MEDNIDLIVKAGLGAGGLGLAGGLLTVTEWMAVIGLLLTLLTTIVNWYYKNKHNKREQEKWEFERNLRKSKNGTDNQ